MLNCNIKLEGLPKTRYRKYAQNMHSFYKVGNRPAVADVRHHGNFSLHWQTHCTCFCLCVASLFVSVFGLTRVDTCTYTEITCADWILLACDLSALYRMRHVYVYNLNQEQLRRIPATALASCSTDVTSNVTTKPKERHYFDTTSG